MQIDIVTVFPEFFDSLHVSLLGKAQDTGLLTVRTHNLRDWTHDVHHSVDDTPVGGGAGMVMKPEVWGECLDQLLGLKSSSSEAADGQQAVNPLTETAISSAPAADQLPPVSGPVIQSHDSTTVTASSPEAADVTNPVTGSLSPQVISFSPTLIFPNPSASPFNQAVATELSAHSQLVFGCGRYEGIDARVPEYYAAQGVDVREYSIGDYVLNGGEVAVYAMIEAITRLIPGFMGNAESIVEESYTGEGLLEHRQFTKPATWRGLSVPEILTSGDHGKVDRFRRDESLAKTARLRPDLIAALDCSRLDKADRKTLMTLGWEVSGQQPRQLPVAASQTDSSQTR